MSKQSFYVLTWSEKEQHYELCGQGHVQHCFRSDDEQGWQDWLSAHTSFAFHGQHGTLSVIKERRRRGAGYWYAYHTKHQQTSKRYLGPTSRATLARLEQEALALSAHNNTPPPNKHRVAHTLPTSSSPPGKAHELFVATRYIPPRLPATLVQRERLFHVLDTVLEHRLLVVSASAGSGKTTLLSTWVRQVSHSVAWLSLDALDMNPIHFWVSVIMSLRRCNPSFSTIGDTALSMLYEPQTPPLSAILTTLINDVLAYPLDVILLLDDYHLIDNQALQETMLFLLDHLPSNLHLILSGQVDPALPLALWRMRGHLVEIRERDMRFTGEEASHFLRQDMQLSLSQEEVEVLENRTEGWIAGLQLAALSLQTQQHPSVFVQSFTGGQRFLVEYVQEEIVQRQPHVVQDFLLRTAILDRMNAALCHALTGVPDSQEMLETLERRNLFVVALDEQRQWFRLHALFRDVLLARLHTTRPTLVPSLHEQAARWYDKEGYVHEAIAHALSAKNFSLVISIVEREAHRLWMQGEAKTVATWILMLPDDIIWEHVDITLTSALHLLLRTQSLPEPERVEAVMQGEQILVRAEQMVLAAEENMLEPSEVMRWRHRIRVLRGLVVMSEAFREGDMRRVRFIAEQMQPLVGEETVVWKWIPLYGLFVSSQWLGDASLLLPDLLALKQQAFQEQDYETAVVVMCWIAAALLYQGKLRLLQQECLHVQGLLEQAGRQVAVGAYPAFDLSFLYYARNQPDKAEACLQRVIDYAGRWQDMNLLVWSYGTIVNVLLAAGKLDKAEQALQEAQRLMQHTGYTVYSPTVNAAQVALWLAQGNVAATGAWAEQYHFHQDALEVPREEEYLMLIRVFLAQQRYEDALRLLASLLDHMERVERVWDIIHLLALQVVAFYGSGETTQARQAAIRLLILTQTEGYIRVYLDAGEAMQQVLMQLRDVPAPTISFTFISQILAAFEPEKTAAFPTASKFAPEPTHNMAPVQKSSIPLQEPFEPLSPQEHRVFQLLVVGRTYAEIAQELIVSHNTIKTQVSSIYRKLGVSRRAEASAVAQHLHLL